MNKTATTYQIISNHCTNSDSAHKRVWESMLRDASEYIDEVTAIRRDIASLRWSLDQTDNSFGLGLVPSMTGIESRGRSIEDRAKYSAEIVRSIKKAMHFVEMTSEQRDEIWEAIQADIQTV